MRGDLIRLLVGAIAGAIMVGGYATWRILEQGDRDERRPVDAIVVMGAAQYDGRPSPVFQARLDHAIALHRAGLAPLLVVTGGKSAGDRTTEAAAARRYAIDHGVEPAAILVEDRSTTTLESIRNVAPLLRERNVGDVLFVSDRTHMLRVLRIARDEGLRAWGSATSTSPTEAAVDRRINATAHELAALAILFLTGGQPPDPPS